MKRGLKIAGWAVLAIVAVYFTLMFIGIMRMAPIYGG